MTDNKHYYWWCKMYLCFPEVWLLNRPFHQWPPSYLWHISKVCKTAIPAIAVERIRWCKGIYVRKEDVMHFINSHTGTQACFCFFGSITETLTPSGQQRRHKQSGSCTFILGTWLFCGCTVSFSMTTPEKPAFSSPVRCLWRMALINWLQSCKWRQCSMDCGKLPLSSTATELSLWLHERTSKQWERKQKQKKKITFLQCAACVCDHRIGIQQTDIRSGNPCVFTPCMLHRTSNNAAHTSQCSYKKQGVWDCVFHKLTLFPQRENRNSV